MLCTATIKVLLFLRPVTQQLLDCTKLSLKTGLITPTFQNWTPTFQQIKFIPLRVELNIYVLLVARPVFVHPIFHICLKNGKMGFFRQA